MYHHRHRGPRHHAFRGPPWARPMGPLGRFVRARLKRRIFVWFMGGLVSTAITVSVVMGVVAHLSERSWDRTLDRTRRWAGSLLAERWDDPPALRRFTVDTARDLELGLEVRTSDGRTVARGGPPCERRALDIPVVREGALVGQARVCFATQKAPWGWQWALMGVLAAGAVWFASGRVARRLARPLDELARVVQKIGGGDLKARAELSCVQSDEIGLVAVAVNDMAARIEKQMADQRELLATVSHELRTPLARIRIISELAREGHTTPRTFDDLDREVVEMDALVGDLLAHSRVEFGQLSRKTLQVAELASDAALRAGVDPSVLDVATPATVDADPTLVHRALANLFDNARRHAGGVDQLSVRVDGGRVRFEVADRGPGLPADPSRLFLKFTRGENGAPTGLGLGLALVKRIAEAHGGDVFALPRDGGGAVFGFWLPERAVNPGS